MKGRRGRKRKQLIDDFGNEMRVEIERGSTGSHLMENWLWKMLGPVFRQTTK